MIIAIDGSIATGKSTVAKTLAHTIGFIFFDTGAMYRSFTYGLLKHGINLDDKEEILKYLETFDFDIKIKYTEKSYLVDGEDVTKNIRSKKVTEHVSKVSAIPEVRQKLVAMQRKLAHGVNAIFEGRDIGTEVFPDADLKIFLSGDETIRAQRRYKELKEKFPEESKNLTLEETIETIRKRDHYDMNRKASPLKQADDAYVIDTTNLSVEEIVFKILEYKENLKTLHDETV